MELRGETGGEPGICYCSGDVGDGLSCAIGALKRLQLRFADATGTSATAIGISAKADNISTGDTRYYQIGCHDPARSHCGDDFNASSGYKILGEP